MKYPLVIISGPSGSGKTSIIKALLQNGNYYLAVSATSRPKRETETDTDYFFRTEKEILNMDPAEMVEIVQQHGYYYCTLRSELEKRNRFPVLLDVDVCGMIAIRKHHPDAVTIFIAPPSIRELERRLRSRADTPETQIQRRLERATWELSMAAQYDYVVVNAILEHTVARVQKIINDWYKRENT